MNESTFPGTQQLPTPMEPIPSTADQAPVTPPEHDHATPAPAAPPAPVRTVTPPSNYAEMPRPTAKLTAEDMAPVNDPHGPRNKIGPTGRPLPDLPAVLPPTRR